MLSHRVAKIPTSEYVHLVSQSQNIIGIILLGPLDQVRFPIKSVLVCIYPSKLRNTRMMHHQT